MGRIDIHSHILSGVDDGAKDLDIALDMAKQYIEVGIDEVIATPHYIKSGEMNSSYRKNLEKLRELRIFLNKENIPLKIYMGNQVYIDPKILELLDMKLITSLNKSRYLLIELPIHEVPDYIESLILDLIDAGYRPIISHPEKNMEVIKDPNLLIDLIELGALIQLNIPSLQGKLGLEIRDLSRIMISHNMVHFLATDSHSNLSRSPLTSGNLKDLETFIAKDDIDLLLKENPKRVIEDKDIDVIKPKRYKKTWKIIDLLKNI